MTNAQEVHSRAGRCAALVCRRSVIEFTCIGRVGELPKVQASSVADAAINCLSGRRKMKWAAPKVVELPVGMEINMYACASRAQIKTN